MIHHDVEEIYEFTKTTNIAKKVKMGEYAEFSSSVLMELGLSLPGSSMVLTLARSERSGQNLVRTGPDQSKRFNFALSPLLNLNSCHEPVS